MNELSSQNFHFPASTIVPFQRRHDIQHNDTQHNETQHDIQNNNKKCHIRHNDDTQ